MIENMPLKPVWVRFELAVNNLSDSVECLREIAKNIRLKDDDNVWTVAAVDQLMSAMRCEMDQIATRIDKMCDDAMCGRVAIAKHRIEAGIAKGAAEQESR